VSETKQGATTVDLEIAVKEGGEFKSPKAISRAMAIARSKFEKEGIMPEKKTKKTRTKKSEHKDEISQLRTDIAALRKQMKALDGALRKEQSSKLLSAIASKTLRLTILLGSVASYPVRHPISSVRAVGHGISVSTSWVGQQVKKPFSWLAAKALEVEEDEAEAAPATV